MNRIEIAAKDIQVGMLVVFGTAAEAAADPARFAPHTVTATDNHLITRHGKPEMRNTISIEREETLRSAGCEVDGTWTRRGSFGRQADELVTVLVDAADAAGQDADPYTEVRAAKTADDLLTALAGLGHLNASQRKAGLRLASAKILRQAADLCGVGDADYLTKTEAIGAIVANF